MRAKRFKMLSCFSNKLLYTAAHLRFLLELEFQGLAVFGEELGQLLMQSQTLSV